MKMVTMVQAEPLGIMARFRGNTPQRENILADINPWDVVDVLHDPVATAAAHPRVEKRVPASDRERELVRDPRRRDHIEHRQILKFIAVDYVNTDL